MNQGAKKMWVLFLLAGFIVLDLFPVPSISAASDYQVIYQTQCDWNFGFIGQITIKNTGTKEIDQWKLEFDWDRNISSLWNSKIESKLDNHYVISYGKHNTIIQPGESVTIGFTGRKGNVSKGPSNFKLTDIYDQLNIKDMEWQQYSGMKATEEFQKSFAYGFCYMWSKFPIDEPHRIGYEMIEKNPVEKFIQARYKNIEIPTFDGLRLKGLFFPVKKAKGTIIMLHGYGSTAIWETAKLKYLLDNGYQILSFNSRYWNFWKTPEKYTEIMTNEVKDVNSAVNYLKTRNDVDKNKIGIYGFSYGACKAELYAHLNNDVKVFVFDGGSATIPTYSPGVTWEMVVKDVMKINKEVYNDDQSIYKNLDVTSPYISSIAQLKKPALFIHGINDTIPVSDVEALYNASGGPKEKYIFPNSGHCDAMYTSDKAHYESKVLKFLDTYLK